MVPVINLRNEPKLREAFEYAHVHDNTVLIDRRTKWGNRFSRRPLPPSPPPGASTDRARK